MKQPWQIRLAIFAKKYRALFGPVYALLFLGCFVERLGKRVPCFLERPAEFRVSQNTRQEQGKRSLRQFPASGLRGSRLWRPFSRFLAASLAVFVLFSNIPFASFHMEEAEAQEEVQAETLQLDNAVDGEGGLSSEPDAQEPLPEDGSGVGEPVEEPMEEPVEPVDESATAPQLLITGFFPLAPETLTQTLPVGTPREGLALPETLRVTVIPAGVDTVVEQEIPANWESLTQYNSENTGDYVFVAQFPDDVILAEGLVSPAISVSLVEAEIATFDLALLSEIYVSDDGDDDYTGLDAGSSAKPYKTLQKALEQAGSSATIKVRGTVKVANGSNAVALALIGARNITITSAEDEHGTLLRDADGKSMIYLDQASSILTLQNITINGNGGGGTSTADPASLVRLNTGSTLTINSGTTLTNNTSGLGGAVYVSRGTVNMHGGLISGNTATQWGGGIMGDNGAKINLHGGSITGNHSNNSGGGIGIYMDTRDGPSVFTMYGGTLDSNTASGNGQDLWLGQGGEFHPINGTVGTFGSGGYYIDYTNYNSSPPVTAIGSGFSDSAKVYTENAEGTHVATDVGYSAAGKNIHHAAARFMHYAQELSVGVLESKGSDKVVLSSSHPVKLQLEEGGWGSYYPTFDDALAAVSATDETPIISLRRILTGGESPVASSVLNGKSTTVRSESLEESPYGTATAFSMVVPGGTMFHVGENKQLTFESVTVAGSIASGIINVNKGTFNSVSQNVTIANGAGPAVTVENGVLNLSGGSLTTSAAASAAVKVANGTFNMTGGVAKNTAGNGVAVSNGVFDLSGELSGSAGYGVELSGGGKANLTGAGNVTGNGAGGVTMSGGTLILEGGAVTSNRGNGVTATGGVIDLKDGTIGANDAHGLALSAGPDTSATLNMTGGSVVANGGNGVNADKAVVNLSGGSVSGFGTAAGVHLSGGGTLNLSASGKVDGVDGVSPAAAETGVYMTGASSKVNMTGGSIVGNSKAGLDMQGGTLTLDSGSISENDGAGVLMDGGTLNMNGGSISGNKNSGVRMQNGSFTLAGTTAKLEGNESSLDGGGVYLGGTASFAMKGGAINRNGTTGNGGGVFVGDTASFSMEQGAAIGANTAGVNGGGVYYDASTDLSIKDRASVTSNTAAGNGGGVYLPKATLRLAGTASIDGENKAVDGGGVYIGANGGISLAQGTSVKDNKASGNGGGIYYGGAAG